MYKKALFLFLLLIQLLSGQNNKSGYATELSITLRTLDFKASIEQLNRFIQKSNAIVQSRNDNRKSVSVTLMFSNISLAEVESTIENFGLVSSKKINTVNNQERLRDINSEITYLKNNKAAYEDLMQKIDSKSEKYTVYWSEARAVDEKIFQKERELNLLKGKDDYFIANVIIEDEQTSPERTDVSYVNMPGFEYSFLQTENPKAGLSAKDYSGYFLKYLFTKGKTFAILGAFKSNAAVKDTTTWSEIFIIGFGQDFYSRYLGGGDENFFNLYSGYQMGYAYITNKNDKEDVFFLSPTIGLELFKNKYILWDAKVNYFLPFSYNKNLRGLSYATSFNFVF